MKWISVKERFPPSNTLVLTFEKGWGYDICSYNAEEGIWRIFGDNDPSEVEYWMPLPEPPSSDEIHSPTPKHLSTPVKATTPTVGELPPKVPGTKESLQRTICLLGNLVKAGSLNEKPRQELVSLIGSCPTPAQAALWKASLRQLSNSVRHG
jgi:hypothetical protein